MVLENALELFHSIHKQVPRLWPFPDEYVALSKRISWTGRQLVMEVEEFLPCSIRRLVRRLEAEKYVSWETHQETFRTLGGFPQSARRWVPRDAFLRILSLPLRRVVWGEAALQDLPPHKKVGYLRRLEWVKFIRATWDCLRVNLNLLKFRLNTSTLSAWIEELFLRPEAFAEDLKLFSDDCRRAHFGYKALCKTRFHVLLKEGWEAQLSTIGRSLPAPRRGGTVVADFIRRQAVPLDWDTTDFLGGLENG
jgi:hypothetical protein